MRSSWKSGLPPHVTALAAAALLVGLGAGCTRTVPVSTTDGAPPRVSLMVASHGRLGSVEGGGDPVTMVSRQGSSIGVITEAHDPQGARYTRLIVVSGGMFRDDAGNLVAEATDASQVVDGATRSSVYVGGTLVPDSPTATVVVRAEGSDWADNVVTTPTITITQRPPPAARLSASQTRIDRGAPVTLTYETDHAGEATLDGVALATLSGSLVVSPAATTTYTLEARNEIGRDAATLTVEVVQPPGAPRIELQATPSAVQHGGTITLHWNCINTTRVDITRNGAAVVSNGGAVGSQALTMDAVGLQTFRLTASGPGGTNVATVTVEVTAPPTPEPRCLRTSCLGDVACFARVAQDGSGSIWQMNLTPFTSSGRITTIRNRVGLALVLEAGNEYHAIGVGETSGEFAGIGLNTLYTVVLAHAPAAMPTHIDLEVCYE